MMTSYLSLKELIKFLAQHRITFDGKTMLRQNAQTGKPVQSRRYYVYLNYEEPDQESGAGDGESTTSRLAMGYIDDDNGIGIVKFNDRFLRLFPIFEFIQVRRLNFSRRQGSDIELAFTSNQDEVIQKCMMRNIDISDFLTDKPEPMLVQVNMRATRQKLNTTHSGSDNENDGQDGDVHPDFGYAYQIREIQFPSQLNSGANTQGFQSDSSVYNSSPFLQTPDVNYNPAEHSATLVHPVQDPIPVHSAVLQETPSIPTIGSSQGLGMNAPGSQSTQNPQMAPSVFGNTLQNVPGAAAATSAMSALTPNASLALQNATELTLAQNKTLPQAPIQDPAFFNQTGPEQLQQTAQSIPLTIHPQMAFPLAPQTQAAAQTPTQAQVPPQMQTSAAPLPSAAPYPNAAGMMGLAPSGTLASQPFANINANNPAIFANPLSHQVPTQMAPQAQAQALASGAGQMMQSQVGQALAQSPALNLAQPQPGQPMQSSQVAQVAQPALPTQADTSAQVQAQAQGQGQAPNFGDDFGSQQMNTTLKALRQILHVQPQLNSLDPQVIVAATLSTLSVLQTLQKPATDVDPSALANLPGYTQSPFAMGSLTTSGTALGSNTGGTGASALATSAPFSANNVQSQASAHSETNNSQNSPANLLAGTPWRAMPEVEIKILDERLKNGTFPLPDYATSSSAGMDLRAMIEGDLTLQPQECQLLPTGIAMFLKNPYLCATVLPRSGLGYKHGIVLGNLTGLIDADYQGPLMVPLWNRSNTPFTIHVGDRIAQMVLMPIVRGQFKIVDDFEKTKRNTGGFGSTGKA